MIRHASSTSCSPMISGGSRRTTLSPAGIDSSPLSSKLADQRRLANDALQAQHQADAAHLGERRRESARRAAASRRRSVSPISRTCARKASSETMSSTALPTAIASGLPPKVEPWLPGANAAATAAVARQAPIGKPPPRPLAIAITSGVTPTHSCANSRPVRPMPHCTSSKNSSSPCASASSRRPRRKPSDGGVNAALALDRLDQDRRGLSVRSPRAPRRGRRTARDRSRRPSARTFEVLLGAARGDGRQRSSVEGAGAGDHPVAFGRRRPCRWYLRTSFSPHSIASAPELQKKAASAKVAVGQPPRQALLIGNAVEVRAMPEPAGLRAQRIHQMWMTVAEHGHRDAGAEVEVAPTSVE